MEQRRAGNEPRKPGEDYRDESVEPTGERGAQKKESWEKPKERSRTQKRVGYVAAIIVNFILLYLVNNLLAWRVPFLTSEFVVPLRYLNISLGATMVANLLFLSYDPKWFLAITRTALNVIGIVVSYSLYVTFPFDLSSLASEGLFTLIVRIALILGIVGAAIGAIVEFVNFIKAATGFAQD